MSIVVPVGSTVIIVPFGGKALAVEGDTCADGSVYAYITEFDETEKAIAVTEIAEGIDSFYYLSLLNFILLRNSNSNFV